MFHFPKSRWHATISEVLPKVAEPGIFFRETIGDPVLSKDYQRENVVFWAADVYYEEYYSRTPCRLPMLALTD